MRISNGRAVSSGKRRVTGFTLIEVLLALFIFVLVIGTIYSTLRVCVDSLHRGQKTIEVYQTARVAMNSVLTDLRRAVSPQSVWNNLPELEEQKLNPDEEETEESIKERRQRDKNKVLIRFIGSSNEAGWVVEDVMHNGKKAYDLYTVAYKVDQGDEALYKEIKGSVLDLRLEQSRMERLQFQAQKQATTEKRAFNETEFRQEYSEVLDLEYLYNIEGGGDDSSFDKILIANAVQEIKFQYYDGNRWRNDWDSEDFVDEVWVDQSAEPIYDSDGNLVPTNEEELREKLGLPDAVLVQLKLINGDVIAGIAEIPARDFDLLIVGNEGYYQSREGKSVAAYNARNKYKPREGTAGRESREYAFDGPDRLLPGNATESWRDLENTGDSPKDSKYLEDGWEKKTVTSNSDRYDGGFVRKRTATSSSQRSPNRTASTGGSSRNKTPNLTRRSTTNSRSLQDRWSTGTSRGGRSEFMRNSSQSQGSGWTRRTIDRDQFGSSSSGTFRPQ